MNFRGHTPSCQNPHGVALSDTTRHDLGTITDTWKGLLGDNQVCIKALRAQEAKALDKIKRVCDSFPL